MTEYRSDPVPSNDPIDTASMYDCRLECRLAGLRLAPEGGSSPRLSIDVSVDWDPVLEVGPVPAWLPFREAPRKF